MSKKNEIIEQDGIKYTVVTLSDSNEVKIRHPKGKDLRFAMSAGRSNEADLTFRLASNLKGKERLLASYAVYRAAG